MKRKEIWKIKRNILMKRVYGEFASAIPNVCVCVVVFLPFFWRKNWHSRTDDAEQISCKREVSARVTLRLLNSNGIYFVCVFFFLSLSSFFFRALECAIRGHFLTYSFDNLVDNQAQTPAKYENEVQK